MAAPNAGSHDVQGDCRQVDRANAGHDRRYRTRHVRLGSSAASSAVQESSGYAACVIASNTAYVTSGPQMSLWPVTHWSHTRLCTRAPLKSYAEPAL